jgi:SHS2 domain-containing protein
VKKYRLIDHTADVGLVAQGNSLADAFSNAAYGMFSIIVDLRTVRNVESRFVKLEESDSEALLYEWLNHLIYVFDVEMLLFKKFEMQEFTGTTLTAICYGEKYDVKRHQLGSASKRQLIT